MSASRTIQRKQPALRRFRVGMALALFLKEFVEFERIIINNIREKLYFIEKIS